MFAIILTATILAPVLSQLLQQNSGQYCPYGTQPYAGGASITCTSDGAICAAGYTCQRAITGGSNSLYCCSSQGQGDSSYCPMGGRPNYVSGGAATSVMVPQSCSSGTCTPGYTCQPSSFGGLSYCCSSSGNFGNTYNDPTYNNNNNNNNNNNAYQDTYSTSYPNYSNNNYGYTNPTTYTTSYPSNSNNNAYQNTYSTSYPSSYSNNYATSNTGNQNYNYATSNTAYPSSNTNYYASNTNSYPATSYTSNNNNYNNANSNTGFYYTTTAYPATYSTGNNNYAYNNGYNYNSGNTGYNTASSTGYNYNNGYNTAATTGYNYNNGYNTASNTGYNYNTAYNTGYSNSATASQYCPTSSTPWYYPGTQYVPSCTVGISICPYPSICQSTSSTYSGGYGHCCIMNMG